MRVSEMDAACMAYCMFDQSLKKASILLFNIFWRRVARLERKDAKRTERVLGIVGEEKKDAV